MDQGDFRDRRDANVDDEIEGSAYESIGAAIEVHRVLGRGLLESVYKKAMSIELPARRVQHQVEAPFDIFYNGQPVGKGSVDILVGKRLVLELKAIDNLTYIHTSKAITYLAALDLPLALIMNFNVSVLKDGIRRVVHTP